MDLSVVVPTLDARDALESCLDGLTAQVPDAEVIVVNGPSADGTTGMVQERTDVSVLIEVAERSVAVARNAGLDRATGDVVAFLDDESTIGAGWSNALSAAIGAAPVVTGPTRAGSDGGQSDGGPHLARPDTRHVAGRTVSFVSPGNVAIRADVLVELDGFDEYLDVGSTRDLAHRLAAVGATVRWAERMQTTAQQSAPQAAADGGNSHERREDWGWTYRSLAYRLVKNYNLRPSIIRRLLGRAAADGSTNFRDFLGGNGRLSEWFHNGRNVTVNLVRGSAAGVMARRRDPTTRRNPHGRSSRADRAVTVYDWR